MVFGICYGTDSLASSVTCVCGFPNCTNVMPTEVWSFVQHLLHGKSKNLQICRFFLQMSGLVDFHQILVVLFCYSLDGCFSYQTKGVILFLRSALFHLQNFT